MTEGMSWENIPEALLADCAQLVKANSIEGISLVFHIKKTVILILYFFIGNKKDNLTVIYTPADNLKVYYHRDRPAPNML